MKLQSLVGLWIQLVFGGWGGSVVISLLVLPKCNLLAILGRRKHILKEMNKSGRGANTYLDKFAPRAATVSTNLRCLLLQLWMMDLRMVQGRAGKMVEVVRGKWHKLRVCRFWLLRATDRSSCWRYLWIFGGARLSRVTSGWLLKLLMLR